MNPLFLICNFNKNCWNDKHKMSSWVQSASHYPLKCLPLPSLITLITVLRYTVSTSLTHCRLNRLSHTIYWKSPISILGMSGYVIYRFLEKKWLNYLQTVKTLIRRRILWRLIWVCTVCQLPFTFSRLQWVKNVYIQTYTGVRLFSRTLTVRTSFGPWTFVLDISSSSH